MKSGLNCAAALGVVALAGAVSCSGVKEKPKPLNVIFIMLDDHALKAVGAYGDELISTPNIDRIAASGIVFDRSFVTNSISTPSRCCLMTGKFGHISGCIDNSGRFDPQQQTLPELLQAGDIQTAVIGKWHLPGQPAGFDYWNVLENPMIYYNPVFDSMGHKAKAEGYATGLIMDRTLDWLTTEKKSDKPFCLFITPNAPHRTWMPDVKDLGIFDGREFPLPGNFYDTYEGRPGAAQQRMSIVRDMDVVYDLKMTDPAVKGENPSYAPHALARLNTLTADQRSQWDAYYKPVIEDFKARKLSGKELAEWKYQRYIKDYLTCVKSIDDQVGRLMDYLEQSGLLENTMIVYTSDQGFFLGEHGLFDKRFMYEESFRTPLIIRMPGGDGQGHRSSLMVQNLDYAPTILEAMGLPVPDDMQGVSLLPVLKGEEPADWRKSVYYRFYENNDDHAASKHYGVRTERYKLIRFCGPVNAWELYDLQEDPSEMKNLYSDPAYVGVVTEMKAELTRLQTQYKDTQTE